MTPKLEDRLRRAVAASDLFSELEAITEDLRTCGADLGAVTTILRFMEDHPQLDLGTPGPLVHFVEEFLGSGYEDALLASLRRRPTSHTAWMLNRLINVTRKKEIRGKYILALRAVGGHPSADDETKYSVADFLRFQLND
jgi:hypothetical protein